MSSTKPFDVSTELASLKHERKNHSLHRLPPNATIRRRPLNHGPVASPYAGAEVQKVVYVSSSTPTMAAVKRVKKLLHYVEKRATQKVDLLQSGEQQGMRKVAEASQRLTCEREGVLVKASGRAMERALRIAQWFRNVEKEMLCKVEVRTGSVSVVDDIVPVREQNVPEDTGLSTEHPTLQEESRPEEADTTMELLHETTAGCVEGSSGGEKEQRTRLSEAEGTAQKKEHGLTDEGQSLKTTRRGRRKKRPTYDQDNLPEARVRWVKTIEIAISLKG